MDALGAGGVEADRLELSERLDQAGESAMAQATPGGCRAQARTLMGAPAGATSSASSASACAGESPWVSCRATWRSAAVSAAATSSSTAKGPGTIRRRRRVSSRSAAATVAALVLASAAGSSHLATSRRRAGVRSAKPKTSRRAARCA